MPSYSFYFDSKLYSNPWERQFIQFDYDLTATHYIPVATYSSLQSCRWINLRSVPFIKWMWGKTEIQIYMVEVEHWSPKQLIAPSCTVLYCTVPHNTEKVQGSIDHWWASSEKRISNSNFTSDFLRPLVSIQICKSWPAFKLRK